jgi:hypothetical protein
MARATPLPIFDREEKEVTFSVVVEDLVSYLTEM